MTAKKPIYRPGDRVVIMQPQVFVRCGYPFDIVAETDRILNQHESDIWELIGKIDPSEKPRRIFTENDMRSVASRLARIVAMRRGYDGNERRIYTRFDADILGKEGTVYSKRVVKTGTRYGPSGGRDIDGHWYESGGLENENTHVILQVYGTGVTMFEIEAANVVHVTD